MIELQVNGQEKQLPQPMTVQQALAIWQPAEPYAIALNNEFVPRSLYDQTRLSAKDQIDIVSPITGG